MPIFLENVHAPTALTALTATFFEIGGEECSVAGAGDDTGIRIK
jgi:hypothetical protein